MTEPTPTQTAPAKPKHPKQNPAIKLALEMGPLVLFFLTNAKFGIFIATGVLMAGVVAALAASWLLTRHVPIMPLVTAVAVLVFGGLTFIFQDELFIKMKPTIVNTIFGSVLLIALAMGKPLLPVVLDSMMRLTETGWKILTLRWGLFFFLLAGLNEVVWRTQTTDFWVSFKVFGTMPITVVFALAQLPLMMKHELKDEDEPEHW
jgi:intracellular septation protein